MSPRLRNRLVALAASVAACTLLLGSTFASAQSVTSWTPDGHNSDPSPITSTWHCTYHQISGYDGFYSCVVASGDYWQGAVLFRQNTADLYGNLLHEDSVTHRNAVAYFVSWDCDSYLSNDVWQVCLTSTVHGSPGQKIDNQITGWSVNGPPWQVYTIQSPTVTLP